jgi:hypothetical protein
MKTVKQGVNEPLVKKFYLFLMLQGFTPSFPDFGYYYSIEELKITKLEISLSTSLVGVLVIIFPALFQKYLRSASFRKLFFTSQFI